MRFYQLSKLLHILMLYLFHPHLKNWVGGGGTRHINGYLQLILQGTGAEDIVAKQQEVT
jgi:hypothetical protein